MEKKERTNILHFYFAHHGYWYLSVELCVQIPYPFPQKCVSFNIDKHIHFNQRQLHKPWKKAVAFGVAVHLFHISFVLYIFRNVHVPEEEANIKVARQQLCNISAV